MRSLEEYKKAANRHPTPAPSYQSSQRLWLSSCDLSLRVESYKLFPCFIGPFPGSEVINPVAVRSKLPRSMRVHPTFHVSHLKPTKESSLVSATCFCLLFRKPLPVCLTNGVPTFIQLNTLNFYSASSLLCESMCRQCVGC